MLQILIQAFSWIKLILIERNLGEPAFLAALGIYVSSNIKYSSLNDTECSLNAGSSFSCSNGSHITINKLFLGSSAGGNRYLPILQAGKPENREGRILLSVG
eukprot:snap_masked-scaffold_6-processed-gene-14.23-mRNA-1 protein AED:1.00 eAED:1.00 QI:0/0/0/0/1/1/2/0/101